MTDIVEILKGTSDLICLGASTEIVRLRKENAELRNSWSAQCESADKLFDKLAAAQKEIAELKDWCEALKRTYDHDLAAAQATNLRLREALEYASECLDANDNYAYGITEALTLPVNNDALREFGLRVAKEVFMAYGGDAAADDFEAIVDEVLGGGE